MVVLTHYNTGNLIDEKYISIFSVGARGCQILFVISGYLTVKSLKHFSEKMTLSDYVNWISKKYKRLAPMYLIALCYCLFQNGYEGTYWSNGARIGKLNIIAHFLLLNGIKPEWSNSILSVEWYIGVLFLWYILAPFVLSRIYSIKEEISVTMLLCSIVPLIQFFLVMITPSSDYVLMTYISNFSLLGQIVPLMLGVLSFYIIDIAIKTINFKALRITIIALIIVLIVYKDIPTFFNFTLWAFVGCMLLIETYSMDSVLNGNSILKVLGCNSYSIYLWHLIIISKLSGLNFIIINNTITWMVKLLIIIITSIIIGKLIGVVLGICKKKSR